jgi:hypothetical protein
VHPANGLLVLEVKDWHLESIVLADKAKVELQTSRGIIVRESSPLEQARKYMLEVVRTLERDGQLLFPAGHRFMGRPILPFGFGAVFTNIKTHGNTTCSGLPGGAFVSCVMAKTNVMSWNFCTGRFVMLWCTF